MALKQPQINKTEQGFEVSGDITKDTAPTLPTGIDCDLDTCEINLSKIGKSDSAAVSVFLSWIRRANSPQQLQFSAVPANLQSLFHLYGVDSLIRQTAD